MSRVVTWGRCYCGRMSAPVRRVVAKDHVREGPFCPQNERGFVRCKPLTPEERVDPGIKAWYSRCKYEWLDFGVREVIKYLHKHAAPTIGSCDGHLEADPYIQFYDEAERDRAAELLDYLKPRKREKRGPRLLLGVIYELYFPEILKGDSQRPPAPWRKDSVP